MWCATLSTISITKYSSIFLTRITLLNRTQNTETSSNKCNLLDNKDNYEEENTKGLKRNKLIKKIANNASFNVDAIEELVLNKLIEYQMQ